MDLNVGGALADWCHIRRDVVMIWEAFPVDARGPLCSTIKITIIYIYIYYNYITYIICVCVCAHVCYLVAFGIPPATRLFFG